MEDLDLNLVVRPPAVARQAAGVLCRLHLLVSNGFGHRVGHRVGHHVVEDGAVSLDLATVCVFLPVF